MYIVKPAFRQTVQRARRLIWAFTQLYTHGKCVRSSFIMKSLTQLTAHLIRNHHQMLLNCSTDELQSELQEENRESKCIVHNKSVIDEKP